MTAETDELGPGWDAVEPPAKGGGGRKTDGISLFMKLEPREDPYHFRLACTPIVFRKHRWAFKSLHQWPISPATDKSQKDLDIAWNEGDFMPVERYAALVFDRDNENRLRIIEEGRDIFGPIYNQGKVSKINPASPNKGWDWIAIVSEEKRIINGKECKCRKYSVSIDTSKNGPTPMTEEELQMLENPKFQREELSNRYFAKSTPEEIRDLWEQLPASAKKNEMKGGKFKPANGSAEAVKTATTNTTAVKAPSQSVQKAPPVEQTKEIKVVPVDKPEDAVDSTDDDFLQESDPSEDGDDDAVRLF